MSKYSFNVFWSPEDEAYIVTCREFPLLSAFGDTPEAALAEMQLALKLAIEIYREEGWPLPEPQVYKGEQPSGKFNVRLPKSLHATLVSQAEEQGVSLNSLVTSYLSQAAGMTAATQSAQDTFADAMRGLSEKLDAIVEKLDGVGAEIAEVKSVVGSDPVPHGR